MSEHCRRLAQAHVEGKAAAETGRIAEPQPRQRVALVAPKLTGEPVGLAGLVGRNLPRRANEVGGPSVGDRHAALER